jgi:hypothetical protein
MAYGTKCSNHSGNDSEFMKPDSVTNSKEPVGEFEKFEPPSAFLRAGGTSSPSTHMEHTAVTVGHFSSEVIFYEEFSFLCG